MDSDELNHIIERLKKGSLTEEDKEALINLCLGSLDTPQAKAKFINYINNLSNSQIGDIFHQNFIIQSLDLESIQTMIEATIRYVFQEEKNQAQEQLFSLNKKDIDDRNYLLKKVYSNWIKNKLDEDSFYRSMDLNLELDELREVVDTPLPPKPRDRLSTKTGIIDKFFDLPKGRRILILGHPGGGKSTALLELTKRLIKEAKDDLLFSVPLIFHLSTWKGSKESLKEWLIEQLHSKYDFHEENGDPWIKHQKLLLLLDGLDEVGAERQELCIKYINKFIRDYPQTEMVICSRQGEYKKCGTQLNCHTAIEIDLLSEKEINRCLENLEASGKDLQGILSALRTDNVLFELARTPLFLWIISLVYEDTSAKKIIEEQNANAKAEDSSEQELINYILIILIEERLDRITLLLLRNGIIILLLQNYQMKRQVNLLWEKYLDRMAEPPYEIRRRGCKYSREETIKWLQFLARNTSSNFFMIEEINRNWLPITLHWQYCLGVGLITGLAMGFYGLLIGLISGSLSFQMLTGLFTGLTLGVIDSFINPEIRFLDSFGFSFFDWKAARKSATPALLNIFIIHFFFTLMAMIFHGTELILSFIFIGLIEGVFTVIISGLAGGFTKTKFTIEDSKNTKPNQKICGSFMKFLITTIITFFLAIIIFSNVLVVLPISALIGCISLYVGGLACIQHMTIRMMLYMAKNAPRNYASFLDYATTRSLMDREGGSYLFKHDLLRKYLLKLEIQTKSRSNDFYQDSVNIILIIIIFVSIILLPAKYDSFKVSSEQERFFNSDITQGQIRFKDNKVFNKSLELKLGDIIFFRLPNTFYTSYGKIIGCPDDTVSVMNGEIIVNGSRKNEYFNISPDIEINDSPKKLPADIYKIITIKKSEENRSNRIVDILTEDIKQKVIR